MAEAVPAQADIRESEMAGAKAFPAISLAEANAALTPEVLEQIEAATPMGRVAEPEEIVGAVLFLASPAASMVTGHILAVDGGYLAR